MSTFHSRFGGSCCRCRFFSLWSTGGLHWCRLTRSCHTFGQQEGQSIATYQRRGPGRNGTVMGWKCYGPRNMPEDGRSKICIIDIKIIVYICVYLCFSFCSLEVLRFHNSDVLFLFGAWLGGRQMFPKNIINILWLIEVYGAILTYAQSICLGSSMVASNYLNSRCGLGHTLTKNCDSPKTQMHSMWQGIDLGQFYWPYTTPKTSSNAKPIQVGGVLPRQFRRWVWGISFSVELWTDIHDGCFCSWQICRHLFVDK